MFFVCVCHSLAVFVRDVVSCMGNYVSILYHNSVISTKNSKNWVTFFPLFNVWTALSTCSMSMNGPNSFQSMDEERIAFQDNKLPFYWRFLPGFNLCKFWAKICASRKTVKTLIWFWQAICVFTNGMRLETARKLLISHGSVIQWPFCSNNFFIWLL